MVDSKCPREEDLTCSFNLGLCGFMQEEMTDDLDWLWHDGSAHDDPYLPAESYGHTHYIYMDTGAPEVLFHFPLFTLSGVCVFAKLLHKTLLLPLTADAIGLQSDH